MKIRKDHFNLPCNWLPVAYPTNHTKAMRTGWIIYIFTLFIASITACKTQVKKSEINLLKEDGFALSISDNIEDILKTSLTANNTLNDSFSLDMAKPVNAFYTANNALPVWSYKGSWRPCTANLIQTLSAVNKLGLFESDYQFSRIANLKLQIDSNAKNLKDLKMWAQADVVLTNAFMHMQQDLSQGRIVADSARLQNVDSAFSSFFIANTNAIIEGANFDSLLASLQPVLPAYINLKKALPAFLDSMDKKVFTYISFPSNDSSAFIKKLQERLAQSGIGDGKFSDSAEIAQAVKTYQIKKGLKPDGKISAALVSILNDTDIEKFKRIAITMDRYKLLPKVMPAKYVWVNLPGYYLHVVEGDSIVLESKIICGKPATPTPHITSNISDIIIYPTWTLPASIVQKDVIPGMKRSRGYLARKGFYLINNRGEHIDAGRVNWVKYNTGIPYMVQQASGDNNALGIIKFNFNNPFAVYLHDTNQRYLYNQKKRSLSHGCVRVKEFKLLADYIAKNDSLQLPAGDTVRYNADSITNWLALKKMHRIPVKAQVPLFIRYMGCEVNAYKIVFYDDMYGEDKAMRNKFFAKRA